MRTKLVVALITKYKNFLCHVVPILTIFELMDIFPPTFTLEGTSVLTKVTHG